MMLLTLEMDSGMLKSLPPCSLNPHGAGPSSTTLYVSMSLISVEKKRFTSLKRKGLVMGHKCLQD